MCVNRKMEEGRGVPGRQAQPAAWRDGSGGRAGAAPCLPVASQLLSTGHCFRGFSRSRRDHRVLGKI